MELTEFFELYPHVAVAFSGGVDSSFLLYAAKSAGADVRGYFVKSQFQPQFELEDARNLAVSLNVPLTILHVDILKENRVVENPYDRCYHCKHAIMTCIQTAARNDGYSVLCDGTNADDDVSSRPGMQAIKEIGVRSPLKECGMTKFEIRRLSKDAGLFTFDKPAYACLATRIPALTAITSQALETVECAENALFELGFSDFRVRITEKGAKLELTKLDISRFSEHYDEVYDRLSPLFGNVLLDLKPRDS